MNHFDGIELDAIPYEDNALISERRYLTWQQEELDAKAWMESHRALQAWTRHDVEALAAEIQATIPEPTEEDLNAFDTIVQNYASIASQIETGDDFSLFIQFLERASFAQTAQSLSGVLVGTRQEISPLRPTTFFLGAHAKVFPALSMYSGIFDESFLAHTTFPPLKERLNKQRQAIFSTLGGLRRAHDHRPAVRLRRQIAGSERRAGVLGRQTANLRQHSGRVRDDGSRF